MTASNATTPVVDLSEISPVPREMLWLNCKVMSVQILMPVALSAGVDEDKVGARANAGVTPGINGDKVPSATINATAITLHCLGRCLALVFGLTLIGEKISPKVTIYHLVKKFYLLRESKFVKTLNLGFIRFS